MTVAMLTFCRQRTREHPECQWWGDEEQEAEAAQGTTAENLELVLIGSKTNVCWLLDS